MFQLMVLFLNNKHFGTNLTSDPSITPMKSLGRLQSFHCR